MAYYVHLLASKKHGTLHLGVTNDIARRGYEHRTKAVQVLRSASQAYTGGMDSGPAPSGASRNDDQLQSRIALRFVRATLRNKNPGIAAGVLHS
jgi:hypothetical protein